MQEPGAGRLMVVGKKFDLCGRFLKGLQNPPKRQLWLVSHFDLHG
jgi:hypothetical protein